MREMSVNLAADSRSSYTVTCGQDLRRTASAWLSRQDRWSRAALICDEKVAGLHGSDWLDALAHGATPISLFTFAGGEVNKTRAVKEDLEDQLMTAGFGRDTLVVALGGGVTLDLAGFVAATYMRGVPWLALPTTTLAMVDSSIGGKVGVDTTSGKNLVGAFHPPQAVLADVRHLLTLSEEDFRHGFAEAIKHGLIASGEHCRQLEQQRDSALSRDLDALESLLAASAAIKVAFVEQDEREQGARKALNFGHTFAHALEKLSGWQIPHGQAVARGLSAECRLSESLGILPHGNLQRVRQLLAAYGLPDDPFDMAVGTHGKEPEAQLNAQSYLDATRGDKKVRGGMVEYVLLSAIGQVHRGKGSEGAWTHAVTDAQVVQALFSEGG